MTGSRDHQIRCYVQKPSTTASEDTAGQIDLSVDANWETTAERYFKVMPSGGREYYRALIVDATTTHVLETPYDDKTKLIDPTFRLKIKGTTRTLHVSSAINVDERNRIVRIACEEVA